MQDEGALGEVTPGGSTDLRALAEADPRRGRISEESPIGRALVGRKKDEEVTAETPSGPEHLVVLDVA